MRIGGQNQEITYWAPNGEDRYGNKTFAAPAIIKGRWEDKIEEAIAPGGQTILSKAIASLDSDVLVNGFLAKGDYSAIVSPDLAPAWEIRAFNRYPDLRNVSTQRKAVM